MQMDRRIALLGGLALASGCAPKATSTGSAPLRFAILSTENSAAQQVKWAPFLKDLSDRLGRPVEPFYAKAYAPLIEAMRFGQVDAGWFANLAGLEAVRRSGGEVFAHTTHPGGASGYHAIIVVKRGRGLTLDRLLRCGRTLSFGMGDPKSTSGTLAPKAWLFQPRNIEPETCFKTVRSASHEANLMAVAGGVVDAATNNTNDLERLQRRGGAQAQATLAALETIWTSPVLPEDPVIWRKSLDDKTKTALRAAFLSYGAGDDATAAHERGVLTNLNFGPFKPATDDHLLRVRELEAIQQLGAARKDADATTAKAADKELAAVRARLAALPPEA